MKLDRGFRFPCVTVKKIKIEVKSTSSPDQKVKAQNSFIHEGFQNHKGSNPTSEMSKISFSCGLDKLRGNRLKWRFLSFLARNLQENKLNKCIIYGKIFLVKSKFDV